MDDDNIEVYSDESRQQVLLRWSHLRMQSGRPEVDGVKRPNRCLADSVAPKSGPGAKPDYVGLFAVTAGLGVVEKERQLIADHDDLIADWARRMAMDEAEARRALASGG